MIDQKQLRQHHAQLETRIDFLETQFQRLDAMLIQFGFDEGIRTLAQTLNEAMEVERILKPQE